MPSVARHYNTRTAKYVRTSAEAAEMSIILQERIATLLMRNRKRPFCDDCISNELSARIDDVRRETEKMKTWPTFVPGDAVCIRCGRYKPAIRAI